MQTLKIIQSLDLAGPAVREVQRGQTGDSHFVIVRARFLVRQREQHRRCTFLGFPNALHRRHFGRLMLQRVEAVHVTDQDLHWNQKSGEVNTGSQSSPDIRTAVLSEPAVSRQAGHQKRHRQARRQQHVAETVGERRIENHLQPAGHMGLAVDHFKPGRRMHPRVERENPNRRHRRSSRHQKGRQGVHALTHPLPPKQHDAEHGGFQEKRGQHFISQQRPGDIADRVHETRPVGTKLKTHGDAADHTQRKGQRKNFDPELVGVHPVLLASFDEAQLEKQQHPSQ